MRAGDRRPDTQPAQGLALAAPLLFLGVLVVSLDSSGSTPLRLALFAAVSLLIALRERRAEGG